MSQIAEFVCWKPSGGPNPVTVDLTGIGAGVTVSYAWMHPTTGAFGATGSVLGGAVRSFTPPDNNGWVLFLRRLDLVYSLFGLTDTTPNTGNLGQGTFVVRADIYERTGESLLGSRELTIVNDPPNGIIIWPTPGWVFTINPPPSLPPQDYLTCQPQEPGVSGVQFRIRPASGGSPVNVGAEVTVTDVAGNYTHTPFVHNGVYADGQYDIDAVVRSGTATAVTPAVRVTIQNQIPGKRQGRRLRGRLS